MVAGGNPAGAAASPPASGLASAFAGFHAFADGWQLLDMLIVFMLAAGLGAIIAYHPRTRAKASTLAELEQPKTFILYALVGAVIAKIVEANSAMAFVVFGIGGLMRFRTDVGPAKDTGRVILTAVVGVCCGLKLLVVAVMATVFGWVLLWILERETFTRLLVKGVPADGLALSADTYRRILFQAGCRILGERKKVIEGQVSFVFSTPSTFDRERLRATHCRDGAAAAAGCARLGRQLARGRARSGHRLRTFGDGDVGRAAIDRDRGAQVVTFAAGDAWTAELSHGVGAGAGKVDQHRGGSQPRLQRGGVPIGAGPAQQGLLTLAQQLIGEGLRVAAEL